MNRYQWTLYLKNRSIINYFFFFLKSAFKFSFNHCFRDHKTSIARKFDQVYYDLDFLAQIEVVECFVTDLIDQYVEQIESKTMKQLERDLSKILFIDEVYRLDHDEFAQKTMNELIDNMIKFKFAEKMIIILADYDNDMNNLLRVNEKLSSRFANEISFSFLSLDLCLQLLKQSLKQSQIAFLSMHDSIIYQELLKSIAEMSRLSSWENAKDIQTLAKSMTRAMYQSNSIKVEQLEVSIDIALNCIQSMLAERCARVNVTSSSRLSASESVQSLNVFLSSSSISFDTLTATKIAASKSKQNDEISKASDSLKSQNEDRDAEIFDVVWQQLQKNKRKATIESERTAQMLQNQADAHRLAFEIAERAAQKTAKLETFKLKMRLKLANYHAYVKRLGFEKWKQKSKENVFVENEREKSKKSKRKSRKRKLLRDDCDRWMFVWLILCELNKMMNTDVQMNLIELMIHNLRFDECLCRMRIFVRHRLYRIHVLVFTSLRKTAPSVHSFDRDKCGVVRLVHSRWHGSMSRDKFFLPHQIFVYLYHQNIKNVFIAYIILIKSTCRSWYDKKNSIFSCHWSSRQKNHFIDV